MATSALDLDALKTHVGRKQAASDVLHPGPANLLRLALGRPAPSDVPWRTHITPDAVLLFRFSALTFNSHRIHYDRPWAVEVEGYPGLVVHGPLTTTLLVDFARDSNPGRRIVSYATQARAPLFDTAPFELRGRPLPGSDGRRCECWAVTPEGTVAMSCEVELA